MENILHTILKPFISLLFPKPLSIVPLIAGAATSLIGGIVSGASGAAGGGGSGRGSGLEGALSQGLPLAAGAAQGIGSLISGRRGRGFEPEREDPEQRRFLNQIQRQRKGFETGVAFRQTQRALQQQQALGARAALRTGRSDLLARLTRGTQSALGEAAAKRGAEVSALTGMQDDLLQRMSQRRLDLQRVQQSKQEGIQAGLRRESLGNILGTVAQSANLGAEDKTPDLGGLTGALESIRGRNRQ